MKINLLKNFILIAEYNFMNDKYYKENFESFINNTKDSDMSKLYSFFEKYLKPGYKVLDLGFGSARDILYFKKRYEVYGIDPVEEFVTRAKLLGINNVYQEDVLTMNFINDFNAIWACASLLHVNKNDLNIAFKKCSNALKEQGIMYASFKYGEFDGINNSRYFIYLKEDTIINYLENTGFKIVEILVTNDVREGRENEKWLNVVLQK